MTTVAAGATGSYTFTSTANAASVTLTQGVRANFTVLSSAGALIASDNIQASRVLGPYPVGSVMSLTAVNGSVDYTAVDADNYFATRAGVSPDGVVVDYTGSPVSGGGIVAAPATLDATNAASYNGGTLSLAAAATLTVHDGAYALLNGGITIQVGQSGTATLAFSGTATKENSSGTSASSVTLAACGVYVLTQSPTGSAKFRLSGGAAT